jgi:hypothetical protein
MTKSFRKKTFGKGSGDIFDDFFARFPPSYNLPPFPARCYLNGLNAVKEF